jgi:hypothetical protein
MAGPKNDGLKLINGSLDAPKPAPRVGGKPVGGTLEEPEFPMLPPGCPVVALGKLDQLCFYLDELRQLIALDPQKHAKQHIRNLFGRRSDLCDEYWPRLDQHGEPKGHGQWHPEIAADVLQRACAFAGIFDPQGRVFGRGAHRGSNDELILHCGDAVFIANGEEREYRQPGVIDGMVYPTAPKIPRPAPDEQGTAVGEELLALYKAWYWARPIVDPLLLLGWTGCAMIAGALPWRPHVWVTGSSATGKSTLQKALEHLLDGGALHDGRRNRGGAPSALEAANAPDPVRRARGNRRQPPRQGGYRRLPGSPRAAATRTGAGRITKATPSRPRRAFCSRRSFSLRCCSKIAIVWRSSSSRRSRGCANPVNLDAAELRRLGARMRRRLIDQWPRLDAMIGKFKAALAEVGHGGRSGDQFGTLLAVADVLLYDAADDDMIAETASWVSADTLAEKSMDLDDEEEAVNFLASTFLRTRGGEDPEPVSAHVMAALQPDGDRARDRLESFGMRIVQAKKDELGKVIGHDKPRGDAIAADLYLAIANSHTQLNSIFEPTRWKEGVGPKRSSESMEPPRATGARSGSPALGRYGRR